MSGREAITLAAVPDAQRRDNVRAEVAVPIALTDEQERVHHAVTLDLSAGGATIASSGPLTSGRRLRVVLDLPDGTTIAGEADVVRAGGDTALRFDLDPLAQEQLIRFVFACERERAQRRGPVT